MNLQVKAKASLLLAHANSSLTENFFQISIMLSQTKFWYSNNPFKLIQTFETTSVIQPDSALLKPWKEIKELLVNKKGIPPLWYQYLLDTIVLNPTHTIVIKTEKKKFNGNHTLYKAAIVLLPHNAKFTFLTKPLISIRTLVYNDHLQSSLTNNSLSNSSLTNIASFNSIANLENFKFKDIFLLDNSLLRLLYRLTLTFSPYSHLVIYTDGSCTSNFSTISSMGIEWIIATPELVTSTIKEFSCKASTFPHLQKQRL
ncbi:hypothetical protein GLOIN_2v1788400 [Rhizophagus clarus]|uniref:Uncharacterized protein n=1 Tax=Rhizophagus clarus TaxID=94130 RepID=A0A8H3KVR2_9GLOM|nr:hypothetical protein GLOIN_2v1788400 [Rhizophagus clarus]